MSVAFGRTTGDVGMMSLVMLTIFAGQQFTMKSLAGSVLLVLSGGFLQTALSVVFWPVRRYVPERRALAGLYTELGRTATDPVRPDEQPPATIHASQAQEALRSLRSDNSEESERYQSLLNQAERARLCVIALLQMQAQLNRNGQQSNGKEVLSRFLILVGRALAAIGKSLLDGAEQAPLDQQIAHVNEWIEQSRSKAPFLENVMSNRILFQMDALAGQLRAAEVLVTGPAPLRAALERPSPLPSWRFSPNSVWATLRANLSLQSAVFRHAVRLTICLTIANIIARATGWRHAYWIPMTVVLLLRPDFAGTFSRGLQRIAGTIVGLVIATALFHFLPETVGIQAALIGICVFLLRWLGPANYGFFAIGVTAAIVLIARANWRRAEAAHPTPGHRYVDWRHPRSVGLRPLANVGARGGCSGRAVGGIPGLL
ncbi:FUSC family protein [Edaphobacter sp. HDX4]